MGSDPNGELRVLTRVPGKAETDPRGHARRRRTIDLALGIGVPLALVCLWQVASTRAWINPRLYPSPTDIVAKTGDLWERGLLWEAIRSTTKRMLIGYGIGATAGVVVGLAMGVWQPVRAALDTLLNVLYTVPKLAVLPVFLTILGFGDPPMIAIVAVTVFFFVWISTLAAVLSVSAGYRESAHAMGVSRWNMFRHVLFPASLPQMFVGFRIGSSVSVLVLIGVELVIAQSGLGYLIQQGRSLLLLSQTFVGIVFAALLGFVFSSLVRIIGRRAMPWAQEDNTPGRL